MLCSEETINQSKHLIHFDIFQSTGCLSDFDNITIRVTHITANFNTMILRLGNEFSSSTIPFLITGPDVCYTNNHEIASLIWVLGVAKRYSWLIVSWAATYV